MFTVGCLPRPFTLGGVLLIDNPDICLKCRKVGDEMITHVEKPILVTELRKLSETNRFDKAEILTVNTVVCEIENNKNVSKFNKDVSSDLASIIQRHIK